MNEPSDRARVKWSPGHRQDVMKLEKSLAVFILVAGLGMVAALDGFAQYAGTGFGSVGVWLMFPSIRPVLSNIADRLPFLKSKTDS